MRHPIQISGAELPGYDPAGPPWPGREVAGLHVRRGPQDGGEPAVLVHGLGGSATNWTDLVSLLAGRVEAEAPDLPGFGRSAPPADGRYTVGAHARAVIALLEQQGRGPVHLFGNSLGGAVATRIAGDRPDLVRTLTLVSPALPSLSPRRLSDPRLPLLLLPAIGSVVTRRLADVDPEQRARAVIELCFADPSAVPPERIDEAVAEVRRRNGLQHSGDAFSASLRGLVASFVARRGRGLWSRAAAVQAPVLLVWGAQDRLVDVALAPRAARTYRDARLLVLEDAGHVAQMERPALVARAFLGMLEQRAGAPAPQPPVASRPGRQDGVG